MSITSTSTSATSAPPQETASSRTVTFSIWSNMVIIPKRSKRLNKDQWYTADDEVRFKQDLIQDVRRTYITLASTQRADMITQEVLQECVGIEAFLGREQRLVMQEKKRAHIRAIVRGQHVFSEQELSIFSEQNSRWAVDKAKRRAGGAENS